MAALKKAEEDEPERAAESEEESVSEIELCADLGCKNDEKEEAAFDTPEEDVPGCDEGEKEHPLLFPRRELSAGNGIKGFFAKYWLYFAAPIIICALFFAMLKTFNVYPFSKTSMSNYDLLAQICPFLEHFYDVIEGKSSLFYSTAIIGGADVFGTLAYCAVSPFTFLFFICGKGNVFYAISYVLPIKLSCVACAAIFFIRKRFKNIPDHFTLTLAVIYAFCGYMFVANTYINWVDFLIYMPFVILGYEKLVKEGRIRYFAIAYALMIYTCFSIACFALLIVYLILIAYALMVVEKGRKKEVIVKTCIALAVAVALSLPITVPAVKAYIKSGRNTGLFENLGNDLAALHLYRKTSYILSDALFLSASIIYFIRSRFKNKNDKFYLVAAVFIMAPVFIDEVCNLLNFGSYMSYALRFGFLNAAFGLYMTCLLLDDLRRKPARNRLLNVIVMIAFACVAVVGLAFVVAYNYDAIDKNLYDFSSKFAHSLGGLEIISPVFGVIGGLIAIAALIYAFRLADMRVISIMLVAVFGVQAVTLSSHVVKGNTFNPVRYEQYREIFNKVAADYEDGTEYYRIKDYDAAITNDAPFTNHTESYSVFSSVIDKANLAATSFFGYGGNNINSIESKGGLFFGDALLGYKYYFLHNDMKEHKSEKRSYNEVLTDTQLSYFAAGRNNLVFPNAYYVHGGSLVFGDYYHENMQTLYSFLGGEGELFDSYAVNPSSIEAVKDKPNYYNVKIYIKDEGQWYMTHAFPEEYDIEYSTAATAESGFKTLEKTSVINFNYDQHNNKNDTSFFHCFLHYEGDLPFDKETIAKYVQGACMPLSKIEALKDSLYERKATYTIKGGDDFLVNVTADGDDCYLFMNYVAIEGFTATVNGKKAELKENGLNFMLVKLDEGENKVEIKYHSPYVLLILLGVLAGAAIVAALYFIVKKQKIYEFISTPVFIAAFVLAAGVLAFFFAFPSVLFIIKLGKLLFSLIF